MTRDAMTSSLRSRRPSRMAPFRALGAALAASAVVLTLSACGSDPVAEQFLSGDDKGYISAELTVQEIPEAERGAPVDFGGVLDSGEKFSSDEIAGDVTVVNFWYAGCGPCRVEAEDLQAVWAEYEDQGVSFIGINTYDQADTARSFADKYGVTYPSIMDVDSGEAKLAFAAATPIQATPTTLVLDAQGRIAARIIGPIDGPSILSTLVRETLAETA